MAKRVELGCTGHFIGASECWWRRHTQVGKYRISSIGEFRPGRGERKDVGLDRFFETMVFETQDSQVDGNEECGCMEVKSWLEVDFAAYNTAGDAQFGHEKMVRKYMRKLFLDDSKLDDVLRRRKPTRF